MVTLTVTPTVRPKRFQEAPPTPKNPTLSALVWTYIQRIGFGGFLKVLVAFGRDHPKRTLTCILNRTAQVCHSILYWNGFRLGSSSDNFESYDLRMLPMSLSPRHSPVAMNSVANSIVSALLSKTRGVDFTS